MILYCNISNANFKRVTGISKKEIQHKGRYRIDENFWLNFRLKETHFKNWLGLELQELVKYDSMEITLQNIKDICFDVVEIGEKSVKISLNIVVNVQDLDKIAQNIKYLCKKHDVKYSKIIRNKDKIPGDFFTRPFGGKEYAVLEEDFLFYLQCLAVVEGKEGTKSLYPSQRNK